MLALSLLLLAAAPGPRLLTPDDVYSLRDVADPQVSPDGTQVAYTVTRLDRKKDRPDADVYMAPLAGGPALRLTSSDTSESAPRFSPDGRWLAFLSSRGGKKAQVFLL